jgi:hypothetical protein
MGILKKKPSPVSNLDYFSYDKVMNYVASLRDLKIKNSSPTFGSSVPEREARPVDPSQATNKASSTSTDDQVSKEGSPQQEDAGPGLQEILILLYNTLIKRIRKEPNIPIQVKAKWYENVDDDTRNSLGIAVLGGGEASQCWSIALYNALFNFGMLNKKYVDTIGNISGACWGGPTACYDKYLPDGTKVTPNTLESLFTPYLEPEQITLNDLLLKKSSKQLISNGSDPLKPLAILIAFIRNFIDPSVPWDLVYPDSYSLQCQEQFNMYSTKSILLKNMAEFRRLQQEEPELLEKLEFVYVLRNNFPECVCMTGGYVPGTYGYTNDQYTYFPVAMTSETDGVVAKRAILSGHNFETFEIGGSITNYASGGYLTSLDKPESKEIIVEMKSVYHLMSLNQMVGNGSAAGIDFFNNNAQYNILAHRLFLNSEKTVPNIIYNTYDLGINYDLSGISYFLSKKTKHIIVYVTCGEKMNVINQDPQNPNNYIPYVLLDIFSKTNIDPEIQNKEPMLQLKDYDETVLGIFNSPTGVFVKKYITPSSAINGIEPYEVEIMWVYPRPQEWLEKLNPIVRFFLTFGVPKWPFTASFVERVMIFPIQANAYLYYLNYQFKNHIADYIKKVKEY